MTMRRRLAKLEARQTGNRLDPSLRRWLGIELTDEETREADRIDAERGPFDPEAVKADKDISDEVRQWLLQ